MIKLSKKELSLIAVARILRKAGAERVSDGAARELRTALEDIGLKISLEALDYMRHAGRKTVKAVDIKIARRKIN